MFNLFGYTNINKRLTFKSNLPPNFIFIFSMENHHLFINRCFELARLGAGKVSPNPMVGAVIVHQSKIIGEGFHEYFGGPHAEINAINSLANKELLKESTLYVSLEPCNNFGKTPPCVEAVLKYKIPKIVLSKIDPNPKTMGKSIAKLKAAGVEVQTNILPEKGQQISAGFFSNIEKKRPYIVLKYAQSLNHKMGIKNENFWITNPISKRLTHKWRSEIDAIMVGSRTLIIDNPKLDNRLFYGNSPTKILLKKDGVLPKDLAVFQSKGKSIIVSEPNAKKISQQNRTQWFIPFDDTFLNNLMVNLKKEGINSLMVEGGFTLLNSFIETNLWDEARVLTGNKVINHKNALPAPSISGDLITSFKIDSDNLTVYRNRGNSSNLAS